ncbi:FtsW/RodA/SpoVE family cell cycle protein [Paenibacillus segetis]|uniref:Rod shape-determining protein RodA n=1 Tax=Paenibacillus segetis TaxID=1325360 RepID=A0ABQ1YQ54_9BACL|nr:FtsW/RodA/SpoVE family cell cycle protein [Paenibacillus segetis]GGH32649.1 rod shape-determining protein RodA [Paenibacillus segetis]
MISKWKRIDWSIVIILLLFMGISVCLIHSGIAAWPKFKGSDTRMVFYYILGFICFFGVILIDYRILLKYHVFIFMAGMLLLVVVLFIGAELNGAQGWIKIPGIGLNLQPAELFKIVLILSLAALLMKKSKLGLSFWKDIVPLALVTLIPFALVMKQNDIGNGLAYLIILVGMLWVGNIKYSHTLIILGLVTLTFYGGVKTYISHHDEIVAALEKTNKAHYLNRIDPWLLPSEASEDASYHTRNAKLAIASGGMFGKGYMKGDMVQSAMVPYTYSDSIIVVVGEEFGFVGISVLILLYFILIYRLILIALECRERAGPLIITGIVAMFLYQIFENIGMFIGLMPLTGITLPFISYGGTSLILNMVSLALVLSIKLYGQEVDDFPLPVESKKQDRVMI